MTLKVDGFKDKLLNKLMTVETSIYLILLSLMIFLVSYLLHARFLVDGDDVGRDLQGLGITEEVAK